MGLYINWDDIAARYPSIIRVGGAEDVSSAHIIYAENELNGRLAPKFTVPFSDNNLTAKDLSVEMTYLRIGNLNIDNKTELSESIDARIARLIAGEENMVDSGGNVVEQTVGGTLWSNTQNYTPTFGHGHVENFEVDQDKINDEADARD